jgi:hypothetical protein
MTERAGSSHSAVRDGLGEMGFTPEQIVNALRALGTDCSVEDAALYILASNDEDPNEDIPQLLHESTDSESKMMLVVREDLGPQPSRSALCVRVCACSLAFFQG